MLLFCVRPHTWLCGLVVPPERDCRLICYSAVPHLWTGCHACGQAATAAKNPGLLLVLQVAYAVLTSYFLERRRYGLMVFT